MSPLASVRAVIVTSTRRFAGSRRTAGTFVKHHEGIPVVVAVVNDRYQHCARVVDDPAQDTGGLECVDVRALVDAQLGAGEYERLVALYPADELVELLRPVVVRKVLARDASPAEVGATVVVSIPDDAEIVAPLSDFIALAGAGLAVSVVRRTALPRDGRIPDEVDLAEHGFVDQQFFAVGPGGEDVLDWWVERSQRHPFVEPARLLTHRVPWLDQAKRMFPDMVVEVPGLTRSYLNADESSAGSAPVLRFTDFDPTRPWIASPLAGSWPRVTVSAHMDLRLASKARARALSDAGHDSVGTDGSPFDHIALGYPYDTVMRALYSEALHAAERNRTPLPPNPFAEPGSFVAWLREDVGDGLSRYLRHARDLTPDLSASFGGDDGALMKWARTSGPKRGFSPSLTGVLPSPRGSGATRRTRPPEGRRYP